MTAAIYGKVWAVVLAETFNDSLQCIEVEQFLYQI